MYDDRDHDSIGCRRLSSSNNTGIDVFSTSCGEEDDALERNKGSYSDDQSNEREVDAKNLSLKEKKNVLDRLLNAAEEDDKFLLAIKKRIDRVGIELPTIEVRFERLSVDAEAYVGSRALPTIFNFTANMLESFLSNLHILPSRKKPVSILHDLNGILKSGRMTLLLGPPSSGKSTLLKGLAGRLDPGLQLLGRIAYNGHGMDEFVPQKSSAYVGQHDVHLGELTVRETLNFSAQCLGVGAGYEMLPALVRREKEANIKQDPDLDPFMKEASIQGQGQEVSVVTDYIIKMLGLESCVDTMVGNEMSRGISGGEKKRVTIGEMLIGPARAFFMDEISNGLDSSTAFKIMNSIKQRVHILEGTALISLLQPAPETYELFDDVVLLSDGKIVYQGPRENVLEFFQTLGFKCPHRKGVADFLQEVTSRKDQKQYWAREDERYSFVSVNEFVEAFRSFHIGRKIANELEVPFDKAKSHPAALTTYKYGLTKIQVLKACISREYLLTKRNSPFYISRMIQLLAMAIISSTLFLRSEMSKNTVTDGGIYMGALYFSLVMVMFNEFPEMPLTILKLPVFYKQRDLLLFPAWSHSLPAWILRIPITFVNVAIWVFPTYYTIGFDSDATRFVRHFFLLLAGNQMASGLFRLMGSLGRDMIVADSFGTSVLLTTLTLGGFILSRDDIQKWWIWGNWISPIMYAQNAVSVNEFLGKSWSHISSISEEPIGVSVLRSRGLFLEAYWYWIGVGALIGYTVLFNFCDILALTYLNPFGKPQTIVSEETAHQLSSIEKSCHSERENDIQQTVSTNVEADRNRKRGMFLPFEPLSITFQDVFYSVGMPKEGKAGGVKEDRLEILKGISGAFKPGVLTALMGVTGAGKTTLLDILSGRKTTGDISGTITLSGYPKKHPTFARIAGYCEQTDIHSPHLTVYESLHYSAWLRLPSEVDSATRKMFIDEVVQLVELSEIREGIVGVAGVNGLSSEQRKRLTIAVELVANPCIIFMDEPTSGLDARAAAIVMRTVRNTVDAGRTVVCTIHQPSIDIFESFDELMLLQRGGEEIYVGPLGQHSSLLIQYFEGIVGVPKIKDGYNPATWMLEVTSQAQESALGINFAQLYKSSQLCRKNKAMITELSKPTPGSKEVEFPTRYSQSFLNQCKACLWKQHHSYSRNGPYTVVRFMFTTFIALMLGTVFWGLASKREKQLDIINAMGCMYASVIFLGLQNSATVQPVVAVERTVFYRERAAGMYSALPYAFGQVVIEIPYLFIQTLIYGITVYAMIGFEWTIAKLCWYLFFMYFTLLYFTLYGMMAVVATPDESIASILSSLVYGLWSLFSGFIIPKTVSKLYTTSLLFQNDILSLIPTVGLPLGVF
ncbi:pleiotropic drug resistance 12 [Perilla frutescens var. hirtella]|uniref:Pleiotropic drug resistance 12 n=1 Tax=Perilla frutescens var. hirtella TaxID=608512 RepID=A0AAD4PAN2_PERFH|nr:pleiotropic drug resistance 12 [Perilla frutescens var. hirtella]